MIMKKMLVVAAAFIVQLCALADNPLWMKYDKPLTVKGGAGIEQFVEAIFGYKPNDWSTDAEYDKRNGYFYYFEEGAGHVNYYVSYWNRKDGKKLVIMSYDEGDFGKRIKMQSSMWGCMSSFSYGDSDEVTTDEAINVDTGFRAFLYDEAKKQLVPLAAPPFNGFDNPVKKHYLLMLPQKGKDIRVREEKGELGNYVYHTLKWNGMTFDFVREGNVVASFYCTEGGVNIRTAPNGKIVYTTPNTGSYGVDILKIENGWCLIDGSCIYEYEEATVVELNGSNAGYWVHSSCIGATGAGAGAPLRSMPDEKGSAQLLVDEDTLVEPVEMRGEWIKVRERKSKKEGWLKVSELCSNPLTTCA